MKISQAIFKLVGPTAPDGTRLKAAMRLEPKDPPLSPTDEFTALYILTRDKNPDVAAAARKSLSGYPVYEVNDALNKPVDPLVLAWVVEEYKETDSVLAMAAMNAGIDDNTLMKLAETGPEEIIMIIADNKERILQNPAILDALKKNPRTYVNVINALDEYVKSGGTAQVDIVPALETSEEQIKMAETAPVEDSDAILAAMKSTDTKAPDEEKPDDAVKPADAETPAEAAGKLTKKEPDSKKTMNIYKLAASLSFGQKIKIALTGNKSVREYFAKDANKLISTSVLKNPRITENEVLRIAGNKSSPDALLRMIAAKKDWLKNYTLKLTVTKNPKTPIALSIKLMESLQAKDIEEISKSKGIPQALMSAAKRKMDMKKKG